MADTTNPFGGGATGGGGGMFGGGMWGSPQGGMQSPYGGGYGMQSPWGGGYGGGYGMQSPFGGGYGMQSPYGASQGYGGGYSPYGMPQGYGGGYGMQSPYGGGYSPYAAPQGYSPYAQQSPYGYSAMPQQQTMMAAQPQAMAATATDATDSGDVTPQETIDPSRMFNIGGSTKTTQTNTPWNDQGDVLQQLWKGRDAAGHLIGFAANGPTTGASAELSKQQAAGPLGFDPNSEAALQRMQALAQGGNPMLDASMGAAQGVASGQYNIGTGGMFSSLYNQPGIQNLGQYQDMYSNPNIGGIGQYGQMAGQNAIGNADQYNQMIGQNATADSERFFNDIYQSPGVNQEDFRQLANTSNSIGTGQMEDIYGGARGPGSLTGGAFGQVARGDLMNGNPYREQAIQDAMNQTSDQVKATMSSRGRYGSDAYGDAMGKALGQVATQARMQGYDTDTANMMAAAQAKSGEALARQGVGLQAAQGIMSAGGQNFQNQLAAQTALTNALQAKMGIRLNAAQDLASTQGTNAAQRLAQIQGLSGVQGQNYAAQLSALGGMNSAQEMVNRQRMAAAQGLTAGLGQNWQNQLGAANALTGVNSQDIKNRLEAAGMAPTMQGLRYDDSNRLLQAGATREAMAQQQKNYNWDLLNRFSALSGSVPGTAGTSKGTEEKPWWSSALGAAGVLGGIWGAAGGA